MSIKELYEQNKDLLTLKESKRYPGLFVLKYKRGVFFKGLWNDFLDEARGLVLTKDFDIVSRPFLKIYNFRVESRAPVLSDDTKITAYRKVNGFMIAATAHEGKLLLSTTGSLDSDFVAIAEKHFEGKTDLIRDILSMPEYTFMFEVCDPSDPHIVDESPGLYFIGLRIKSNGALLMGTVSHANKNNGICTYIYGINQVESFETTVGELMSLVKTVKHEGFVFYTEDGVAAKIKSPYYLTKKMLMRKNIDKLMAMDAKEFLDEEFYPLIDWIREVDRDQFAVLDEIARREYIERWFK